MDEKERAPEHSAGVDYRERWLVEFSTAPLSPDAAEVYVYTRIQNGMHHVAGIIPARMAALIAAAPVLRDALADIAAEGGDMAWRAGEALRAADPTPLLTRFGERRPQTLVGGDM